MGLEPDPKDIVPVLMNMVRDGDPETADQAAQLLGPIPKWPSLN